MAKGDMTKKKAQGDTTLLDLKLEEWSPEPRYVSS